MQKWLAVAIVLAVTEIVSCTGLTEKQPQAVPTENKKSAEEEALISYGRELIAHTAHYLGPKGTVAQLTNGMNCQNCHLQAGTQLFANSYLTVAASYPKFSPRSGEKETIIRKINDCMARSLNGKILDTTGKEMRAMVAYIQSLAGKAPPVGKGASGTQQLAFLPRAANAMNGDTLYHQKCVSCHGKNGEGLPAGDSSSYIYPPVWGKHSYNIAAGIYKISKLAGFIKNNMPFGANYKAPQLTEEQAWDIAAFVNSQPRPQKKFLNDWPIIAKKPFDYPFGPYSDHFSEMQHKYGPYQAIANPQKQP